MAVSHSFRSEKDRDIQVVSIVSVDPVARTAVGLTRIRTTININCSFGVGEVTVTPAVDEQWYVERHEREWRLYGRVPFNDPTLLVEPKEGQVNVGGAKGPLELFSGSTINAHAPIALTPFDDENLPSADSVPPGTIAYDAERDVPIFSDGTDWLELDPDREPAIEPGTVNDYYRGDKTWQTLDKDAVGLGNVDNTSDEDKPISTAVQDALDALDITDISGIVDALDGKVNKDTLTNKGDIYVASAAAMPARLGVGSNNTVLTADSSTATGVKWSTVSVSADDVTGGTLDPGVLPALNASMITSGVLSQTLIPALTGDWSGTIAGDLVTGLLSETVIPALSGDWTGTIAGNLVNGLLNEAVIPAITGDWEGTIAASVLLGVLDQTLIPALTGDWEGTIAASVLTGLVNAANIAALDASKIASGIFSQTLIPAITGDWSGTIAASVLLGVLDQTLIPALTGDWEGTIAASLLSGVVAAANIASLNASKIVDGVFAQTLIPALTGDWSGTIAGNVITGTVAAANIASLNASKIVDGVFAQTLIPALTGDWTGTIASSLLTGFINQAVIPALDGSWAGSIASSLLSGTLLEALIPGLNASKIVSGVLSTGIIPTITAAMTSGLAPIDTLVNSWGLAGSNFTPTDLANIAALIPPGNMVGILGGLNIGNTIQNFVDSGVQAILNVPGSVNNTINQWNTVLNNMANFLGFVTAGSAPTNSVAQISSATQDLVKQRAIQNAVSANIDTTASASFDLSEITNGGTTLPTIPITQAKSVIAYITARDGGIKQAISWLGYGVTNVTDFYVNVGTVNKTTGVFTTIYSTTNIIGGVGTGSTPVWNSINLAALNYINTTSGDRLAVEFAIRGTGTYNIVGKTWNTQLPTHPTLTTAFPAANRLIDTAPTFSRAATPAGASGSTFAQAVTNIRIDSGDRLIVATEGYGYLLNSLQAYCNGVAMTAVGSVLHYNAGGVAAYVHIWTIDNPTTGTSVPIQFNIGAGGGGSTLGIVTAATYTGVSSVVAGTTGGGGGASPALGAPVVPATSMIVQAFGAGAQSINNTYNKTTRSGPGYAGSSGIIMGDTLGTGSSFNFTVTLPGAAPYNWGAVAVELKGFPAKNPATIANPTVSGGTVNWVNTVPWCALSGVAGQTQFSPVITPMMDAAPMSYTPPSWANFFDIVIWPGGASGTSGAGLVGGFGGNASTPVSITLTKAQISGANWTWTNGAGGAPTSPYGVPGNSGGASNVVVPGYGTISANAVGTGNGSTSGAAGGPGGTAGSVSIGGNYYPGGIGGGSPQAAGAQPGGGGAGGNATYLTYVGGGGGGYGGGYICARQ